MNKLFYTVLGLVLILIGVSAFLWFSRPTDRCRRASTRCTRPSKTSNRYSNTSTRTTSIGEDASYNRNRDFRTADRAAEADRDSRRKGNT